MSPKEVADTVLKLLEIAISWPLVILIAVISFRSQIITLLPTLATVGQQRLMTGAIEVDLGWVKLKLDELKNDVSKVKDEVGNVATTVAHIEERIQFERTDVLTPELEKRLKASISSYREYLEHLGLTGEGGEINVRIDPTVENAWYELDQDRMVIHPKFADDPDVALREYTHHALTHAMSAREDFGQWSFTVQAIESALADYFPCSFKGSPLLGKRAARVIAETLGTQAYDRPAIRNLGNERTFAELQGATADHMRTSQDVGEIWGGAFWDMRMDLGQGTTDRLLFATWSRLGASDLHGDNPGTFVRELLETGRALNADLEQIQAIFERRGLQP